MLSVHYSDLPDQPVEEKTEFEVVMPEESCEEECICTTCSCTCECKPKPKDNIDVVFEEPAKDVDLVMPKPVEEGCPPCEPCEKKIDDSIIIGKEPDYPVEFQAFNQPAVVEDPCECPEPVVKKEAEFVVAYEEPAKEVELVLPEPVVEEKQEENVWSMRIVEICKNYIVFS